MKPSTKILLLGAGTIIVVAGYTGGWFYAANRLERLASNMLAGLQENAIEARCDDLDVRGFPFRIGLFCNRVKATDQIQGGSFSAGPFRSAAQVYQPGHVVSELDGPLTLSTKAGDAVEATWNVLRASTVFAMTGLDRVSLQATEPTIVAASKQGGKPARLKANEAQVHARVSGADLDLAALFRDSVVTFPELGASLPAFDLNADLTLDDGAPLLAGEPFEPYGSSGKIHAIDISLGGNAALKLAGPFAISDRGFIDGTFEVTIENVEVWRATLSDVLPELGDTINSVATMIAALGGSDGSTKLTLTASDGNLSAGLIPLGRIPPL